jgi:hypothetical protein
MPLFEHCVDPGTQTPPHTPAEHANVQGAVVLPH